MNDKILSTSNSSYSNVFKALTAVALLTTASVSDKSSDFSLESHYYDYDYIYTSGCSVKCTNISNEASLVEEEGQARSHVTLPLEECPLFIKNTFGISVTDFAKVLNISRPTAYKYLDGEIPSTSNSIIESLYSLAQSWSTNTKNTTLGMEFKRSYDGKSLYDSLIEGDYVQSKLQLEKIAKVVNSRRERAQSYTKSKKEKRVNLDIIRQSVR